MTTKENRWWEFYFVRYLIGTITGALIISYLTLKIPFLKVLIPSTSYNLLENLIANYWIFTLLGFAYCYISSAPILVLHACRAYLKDKDEGLNNHTKRVFILIYILTIILLISSLFNNNYYYFLSWLVLFFFISSQSILILTGIWKKDISNFYNILTTQRKEKKTESPDNYIESYKHLREHGNAFFILMLEIALGFVLINLKEINQLIIVVSLWILPAIYVWLIGTSLEFSITPNK